QIWRATREKFLSGGSNPRRCVAEPARDRCPSGPLFWQTNSYGHVSNVESAPQTPPVEYRIAADSGNDTGHLGLPPHGAVSALDQRPPDVLRNGRSSRSAPSRRSLR